MPVHRVSLERYPRLFLSINWWTATAATNPRLLECVSSWLREIPAADVVNSPLFESVVNSLSIESSFEAAVDCMCTILRDTREVDESIEIIQVIYPRLLSLRPKLAEAATSDDQDVFKGLTRIFAEAGEHWVVMIARLPNEFRGLVEAILESCARDSDREAISLTFLFWYEFKQMITLEKYKNALQIYMDVFQKLVDILIGHMQYPSPEGSNEADLFDGDREQEEKFREFRHQMGDVIKDCCEVTGVTDCLGKAFALIQGWISTYGSQATKTHVPHWQKLEAPLFSMRSMGRMVSPEESVVLHQAIPIIVQILKNVDHEKLRFQAIMCLGRYTEWTAQHPEYLQEQLKFIMDAFNVESQEVVKAAALSFRFFGTDCRKLLAGHVEMLHKFFESVLDSLVPASQEEITEGVACVVSVQPPEKTFSSMKMFCDPIIGRMVKQAQAAKAGDDNEKSQLSVAGKWFDIRYNIQSADRHEIDHLQLLTIFVQHVQPYVSPREENPAVKYCAEILPIMATIAENFTECVPILERLCRCWRYMVLSYRTATLPLLPILAPQLAAGFQNTRQGCFLWATDSVLREFANGAEFVDASTSENIYHFFEQQAIAFLRIMNDLPPDDLPDVIEDFFRLLIDALIYYHAQLIPSNISSPILQAGISALTLQQEAPLSAILHYLRDFLSYGTNSPASSSHPDDPPSSAAPPTANPALKSTVHTLIAASGSELIHRILTGMMFSFPRDCLPDASGVVLAMLELAPHETGGWIKQTLEMLPTGTMKAGEAERLMQGVGEKLQSGEVRKVRVLLQDFTNGYRRRNVAPRDGLGRLEAVRFRFSG